jgi:glucose/arabinose dehydrogenase
MALLSVLALPVAVGCASFSDSSPEFSPTPTLTPNVATVIPPDGARAGATVRPDGPEDGGDGTSSPQAPDSMTQPCAPPALPVVAVCLDDPWGLAPLPSGDTALVGERSRGRILSVTAGREPRLVTTISGLDATRGGGLLGLALSPYYTEDGLVYAYVTTAADARVVRLAGGQPPKAILTGLPVGGGAVGGSLIFGADGLLYVAVGSDERAPRSGAAIHRIDAFGRAAPGNSSGGTLFADGLTDPTGMCLLPDGRVAVVDRRATGDVLIALADGRHYRSLAPGDAVWTYSAGEGGAIDCAVTSGELTTTGRSKPRATVIEFGSGGGFIGSPAAALDGLYGMLRTAVTGPGGLTWLTTANTRAEGPAAAGSDASDDRVVVLPPSGAGGGGGGLD